MVALNSVVLEDVHLLRGNYHRAVLLENAGATIGYDNRFLRETV
jgi:hypothetical protein